MSGPTPAADFRYSTSNTNLAACIGSLKIPIKTEQPITRTESEDGKSVVHFWFENQGAEEFCGSIHTPLQLEKAWNNRSQFEAENPTHPLVPMRAALDKRDWLTKAWHGRIMPAASLDKAGFTTEDIFLASVLMALSRRLLRLDKPRYVFGGDAFFGNTSDSVIEPFNNFEMFGFIEHPVALMRRALECRKILVSLARSPDLETSLRFADGHVDQDGGKMAFISNKSTDQQISETLSTLYKL